MKQVLKDILTAKDGESYDIGRVLLAAGAVIFFGLSIYALTHGTPFDPMNWGAGFGSILGGGGACIGLKSKTEPDA